MNKEHRDADYVRREQNKHTKTEEKKMPLAAIPPKGGIMARFVTPRKMLLIWDAASEIPKRIIESYFNLIFRDLVTVVRIYDTSEQFIGEKSPQNFIELSVPYQHGHWHVKGFRSNRSYAVELGFYLPTIGYFPIYRAANIQSPVLEGPARPDENLIPQRISEDLQPDWIDYVSTYSYYEVAGVEGNND